MKLLAFYNVRHKDEGGQQADVTPLWDVADRFKVPPVRIDNNYLYTDEWVDAWNTREDPNQRDGQPKGVNPTDGTIQKTFDKEDKDTVFDEDVIKSFNKQEHIISQIKIALTGGQHGI